MSYEYDPNAEPEPFCQYCGDDDGIECPECRHCECCGELLDNCQYIGGYCGERWGKSVCAPGNRCADCERSYGPER